MDKDDKAKKAKKANEAGDRLVELAMKTAAREAASFGIAAIFDWMGGCGLGSFIASVLEIGYLAEDAEEVKELMETIREVYTTVEEAEDFVKKKKEKAKKEAAKKVAAAKRS